MFAIELKQCDITQLNVDAIVNAANSSLLGGGGVDGAIHRAAGPALLEECKKLNGCPVGNAKYTKGYNLPAKYIIHTVGPVWQGGNKNEDQLLSNCYNNCMQLAEELEISSIAFPNISTGVYGFPKERAANIAISTIKKFMQHSKSVQELTFVVFDRKNSLLYKSILQ